VDKEPGDSYDNDKHKLLTTAGHTVNEAVVKLHGSMWKQIEKKMKAELWRYGKRLCRHIMARAETIKEATVKANLT